MLSTLDTIQSILSQFSPDSCSIPVQFRWIPLDSTGFPWIPLGTDDSPRETGVLSSFGPLSLNFLSILPGFLVDSAGTPLVPVVLQERPPFSHRLLTFSAFRLNSCSILPQFSLVSLSIPLEFLRHRWFCKETGILPWFGPVVSQYSLNSVLFVGGVGS